jgi:hypothetical protein
MTTLGAILADGKGVRRDNEAAARWFARAAESGVPEAMANLALLHRDGRGTSRDSERAYFWARAAERSWERAQSAARGVGSSRSLAEFVERAARGLDADARARLDAEVGEFVASLPSQPSAATMLAAQDAQ